MLEGRFSVLVRWGKVLMVCKYMVSRFTDFTTLGLGVQACPGLGLIKV